MEILSIFIGGAIGALLRYLIYSQFEPFYIPTFLVNLLGCFIIGFGTYIYGRKHNRLSVCMKNLLTFGLAGGLTTFSTFALDLYKFIVLGNFVGMLVYMLLSVLLGVCCVSLGINLAYSLLVRLIKSRKGYKKQC